MREGGGRSGGGGNWKVRANGGKAWRKELVGEEESEKEESNEEEPGNVGSGKEESGGGAKANTSEMTWFDVSANFSLFSLFVVSRLLRSLDEDFFVFLTKGGLSTPRYLLTRFIGRRDDFHLFHPSPTVMTRSYFSCTPVPNPMLSNTVCPVGPKNNKPTNKIINSFIFCNPLFLRTGSRDKQNHSNYSLKIMLFLAGWVGLICRKSSRLQICWASDV